MADKEKLTRHNIMLHAGDLAAINEEYPGKASAIVRNLVRQFVLTRLPQRDCD